MGQLLNTTDVWLMPSLNPDGFENAQRLGQGGGRACEGMDPNRGMSVFTMEEFHHSDDQVPSQETTYQGCIMVTSEKKIAVNEGVVTNSQNSPRR